MKKLAIIMTCVCVLVALCVISASANVYTGQCGDSVTYTYDSDEKTIIISGTGDMYDYNFGSSTASNCLMNNDPYTILESIYPVPEWIHFDITWEDIYGDGNPIPMGIYFYENQIRRIIIEEGVTSIGDFAFYACNIFEIVLPDSILDISVYMIDGNRTEIPSLDEDLEPTYTSTINTGLSDNLIFICNNYSYAAEFAQQYSIDAHYYQHSVTETGTATCITAGTIEDTCQECRYTYSGEAEIRDHNYEENTIKTATCTDAGETLLTCTRCDDSQFSEIAALGHDIANYEAKAVTCTEMGWEAYEACSRCDYTTYKEIPALGHDIITYEATTATCTETGYDAYETCSRCDYTTYAEIAALGHSFEEIIVTKPTVSTVGQLKRTCKTCGLTEHEEIPMLEIVHGDLDGDGTVSVKDVLTSLRAVLSGSSLDGADMNGDGEVNLLDILRMLKASVA